MDETSLMIKVGEFQNICKNNRVFPECSFISMFEKEIPKLVIQIPKGKIMYRARAYSDNLIEKIMEIVELAHNTQDSETFKTIRERSERIKHEMEAKHEKGFFGYNEEESFVNKNRKSIRNGRCNHEYESCLYTAEDVETAISELKPLIKERISVAEIQVIQDLKLVDVSIDFDEKNRGIKNIIGVFFLISPTEVNKDAYIYTQVICDIVKKLGYDGIKYSSCQNNAKINYAIFNYAKCKAINSDLYSVSKIKYDIEKDNRDK